jgi:hypothetical protein
MSTIAAVRQARAIAEIRGLAAAQRAARAGDWRAAAWWLEHVRPERYVPRRYT